VEPVQCLHQRFQGTGANSSVQGDGEAGGVSAIGSDFVSLSQNTAVRSRCCVACFGLLDGGAEGPYYGEELRAATRESCRSLQMFSDSTTWASRGSKTQLPTGFALRYASISRTSSALRRNSAERTICLACSADLMPTIAPVTTGSRSVQAMATSPGVQP